MANASLLALLLGTLCLPSCQPFAGPAISPSLARTGPRFAVAAPGRDGRSSLGRGGVVATSARLEGPGGEGEIAVSRLEGFDSVTGYGDMTGVAKFDDAWVEAYRQKDRIRCPFWRRRTVDALEVVLHMARFVLARHKSLDVTPVRTTGGKTVGLSLTEVAQIITQDFEERQYYVTGRLSKRIYADDCFFDAPDPDMPVRGLRKYVDAISHLFEHRSSKVDLLSIQELPNRKAVIARWRLEGTLMLPWRPSVRPYTGVTLYELNSRGLISRHTELWSTDVAVAFLSAVAPIDGWLSPFLKGLGIDVPAAAPPLEELLLMPTDEQCPDPAPLLKAQSEGSLTRLKAFMGLV